MLLYTLADNATLHAAMPALLDPMTFLSSSGPFGSAILPALLAVVFIESGLLFPFLPGDSMLFTAGLLTGQPDPFAPLWLVLVTAPIAAFSGDQVGYFIGHRWKDHLQQRPDGTIFKQRYLLEAHDFFTKWGPWAIVAARFVPIVRTFTPLVAGMAAMRYRQFVVFNLIGAIGWAAGVTLLGALLGDIPFLRQHIDLIMIAIVVVSLLPFVSVAATRLTRGRSSHPEDTAIASHIRGQ